MLSCSGALNVTWSGFQGSDLDYTMSVPAAWLGNITYSDQNVAMGGDSLSYDLPVYEDSLFSSIPIVGPIIDWIEGQLSSLYLWLLSQFIWVIDQVKPVFQTILSVVLSPIITALSWIQDKLSDAYHWLTSALPSALEALRIKLIDVWSWVTSAIPHTLSGILSHVGSLLSKVDSIPGAIQAWGINTINTISQGLGTFFDPVTKGIAGILSSITGWLEDRLNELFGWVEVPGTTIWDKIKQWFTNTYFWITRSDAWVQKRLGMSYIKYDPVTNTESFYHDDAAGHEVQGAGADITEPLKWIETNIADPILDAIKTLFEQLASILKAAFDLIWDAIKEFFTVILPNWFRAIWEELRAAIAWVWDKVTDVAGAFLDEILKLVGMHSPISPAGGLGTLRGMVNIGLAMAAGLGILTLTSHLVHPIHSLGLEHLSAMVYDMSNYKLLLGAGMGVIAACSIRIPLTWYFNSILRPNIPDPKSASMMRSRQYITKEAYRQLLAYQGIPDEWHNDLDRLTETRVGYFALAAIARNGTYDETLFRNDLLRAGYALEIQPMLLNMYSTLASTNVKGSMGSYAISRFKDGLTTESQFHDELMLLGYQEEEWPRFLAGARLSYAYDYTKDLITAYKDAVGKGHVSMDGFRQALLGIGMVPERVEGYVLIERAKLKPQEKLTALSPATPVYATDAGKIQVDTLRRQRRKNTISRDQELAGLQALGMPVEYATAIAANDDIRLGETAPAG